MKIALLQTDIIWENKPANLQRAGELIAALPPDVQLVILPEMFSTGFSMRTERIAEDENGDSIAWLSVTAKLYNTAIICSISYTHLQQHFNRLFFVFPDGSYRTYDKRHLFRYGKEADYYAAGTERLIVDYEGWRICPLVCYDLRFPAWARNIPLTAQEQHPGREMVYDLLVYVANWPSARMYPWNTLLAARAIENQAYVIGLNRTSTDPSLTGEKDYTGDSQIIDFKGQVLAKAGAHREEVLIYDLDLKTLNDFRAHFPAWMDADRLSIATT